MARAADGREPLRRIPSIDALLRTDAARKGSHQFGRPLLKLAVQRVVEGIRDEAGRGREPPADDIVLARALRMAALTWYGLSPVVNATGVVLHTGMGRAP